ESVVTYQPRRPNAIRLKTQNPRKSFHRMRRRSGGTGSAEISVGGSTGGSGGGSVGGSVIGQRFRSPALDSGVRMWLPERRLASHPESSSFIFCSESKSLIRPETSGNGVARLPARFIAGSN